MPSLDDAWVLHLAGAPVDQIALTVGRTEDEVLELVATRSAKAPTTRTGLVTELARINELWRVVYPRALSGDARAVETALRLSERRQSLTEEASRTGRRRTRKASRRDRLQAMYTQIHQSIDQAPADKRAPLFAQLLACEDRIAALAKEEARTQGKTGDPVDEIAARRAARGGATSRLGQAQGGTR